MHLHTAACSRVQPLAAGSASVRTLSDSKLLHTLTCWQLALEMKGPHMGRHALLRRDSSTHTQLKLQHAEPPTPVSTHTLPHHQLALEMKGPHMGAMFFVGFRLLNIHCNQRGGCPDSVRRLRARLSLRGARMHVAACAAACMHSAARVRHRQLRACMQSGYAPACRAGMRLHAVEHLAGSDST